MTTLIVDLSEMRCLATTLRATTARLAPKRAALGKIAPHSQWTTLDDVDLRVVRRDAHAQAHAKLRAARTDSASPRMRYFSL